MKLKKINAKYKAVTDKKRQEKLFEKRDMAMSKIFNVADLYHPTMQLYLDYNLRMSSFEEKGAGVGDQDRIKPRQSSKLSTDNISCRQLTFTYLQALSTDIF